MGRLLAHSICGLICLGFIFAGVGVLWRHWVSVKAPSLCAINHHCTFNLKTVTLKKHVETASGIGIGN